MWCLASCSLRSGSAENGVGETESSSWRNGCVKTSQQKSLNVAAKAHYSRALIIYKKLLQSDVI